MIFVDWFTPQSCTDQDSRGGQILDKKTMVISAGLTGAGILGVIGSIDPNTILSYVSETASNQIVRAGFFFTVAAWLHSSRVKKEIAKNFAGLTEAITNLGIALGTRLDRLEGRVKTLEENKGG